MSRFEISNTIFLGAFRSYSSFVFKVFMVFCFHSDPDVSIITGHLTETFGKSQDGIFKDIQLGDCLSSIAKGSAASNTAVISFKPVEGDVETIEEISFAELHLRVMKLASVLKESLSLSLQRRKADVNTVDAQSKTNVAIYLNAGINRVYIQVRKCYHKIFINIYNFLLLNNLLCLIYPYLKMNFHS